MEGFLLVQVVGLPGIANKGGPQRRWIEVEEQYILFYDSFDEGRNGGVDLSMKVLVRRAGLVKLSNSSSLGKWVKYGLHFSLKRGCVASDVGSFAHAGNTHHSDDDDSEEVIDVIFDCGSEENRSKWYAAFVSAMLHHQVVNIVPKAVQTLQIPTDLVGIHQFPSPEVIQQYFETAVEMVDDEGNMMEPLWKLEAARNVLLRVSEDRKKESFRYRADITVTAAGSENRQDVNEIGLTFNDDLVFQRLVVASIKSTLRARNIESVRSTRRHQNDQSNKSLGIQVGDYVVKVNHDDASHWPLSRLLARLSNDRSPVGSNIRFEFERRIYKDDSQSTSANLPSIESGLSTIEESRNLLKNVKSSNEPGLGTKGGQDSFKKVSKPMTSFTSTKQQNLEQSSNMPLFMPKKAKTQSSITSSGIDFQSITLQSISQSLTSSVFGDLDEPVPRKIPAVKKVPLSQVSAGGHGTSHGRSPGKAEGNDVFSSLSASSFQSISFQSISQTLATSFFGEDGEPDSKLGKKSMKSNKSTLPFAPLPSSPRPSNSQHTRSMPLSNANFSPSPQPMLAAFAPSLSSTPSDSGASPSTVPSSSMLASLRLTGTGATGRSDADSPSLDHLLEPLRPDSRPHSRCSFAGSENNDDNASRISAGLGGGDGRTRRTYSNSSARENQLTSLSDDLGGRRRLSSTSSEKGLLHHAQGAGRRRYSVTKKLGQKKASAALLAAAAAAYASAEKPHVIPQWHPIEIPDPVIPPTDIPVYHAHPLENQKTDTKTWLTVFGLIFLCLDPLFSILLGLSFTWLALGLIYLNSDTGVCPDQNTFWIYCVVSTVFSFVSAMISRCYVQYIVSFYVSDYEGATTGDFDDMALSTESLAATVLIEFTMFVYGTIVMFNPTYTCDHMKDTGLWKMTLITYWLRNIGLGVMGYTLSKRVYASIRERYLSSDAIKRRNALLKKKKQKNKMRMGQGVSNSLLEAVTRVTSSFPIPASMGTNKNDRWGFVRSGHSMPSRLNSDTYNPLVDIEMGNTAKESQPVKKRRSSLKDKNKNKGNDAAITGLRHQVTMTDNTINRLSLQKKRVTIVEPNGKDPMGTPPNGGEAMKPAIISSPTKEKKLAAFTDNNWGPLSFSSAPFDAQEYINKKRKKAEKKRLERNGGMGGVGAGVGVNTHGGGLASSVDHIDNSGVLRNTVGEHDAEMGLVARKTEQTEGVALTIVTSPFHMKNEESPHHEQSLVVDAQAIPHQTKHSQVNENKSLRGSGSTSSQSHANTTAQNALNDSAHVKNDTNLSHVQKKNDEFLSQHPTTTPGAITPAVKLIPPSALKEEHLHEKLILPDNPFIIPRASRGDKDRALKQPINPFAPTQHPPAIYSDDMKSTTIRASAESKAKPAGLALLNRSLQPPNRSAPSSPNSSLPTNNATIKSSGDDLL